MQFTVEGFPELIIYKFEFLQTHSLLGLMALLSKIEDL
jgi:hypothetical protein